MKRPNEADISMEAKEYIDWLEAENKKLIEEIKRLKGWDNFKKTLSVMQNFQELDDNGKKAIELMMDGLEYRRKCAPVLLDRAALKGGKG